MTRQSFLKSLLGIAASPKIISEIDFEPPLVSKISPTATLFSQLNFLVPDYLPKMLAKYGNDSLADYYSTMGPSDIENNNQ